MNTAHFLGFTKCTVMESTINPSNAQLEEGEFGSAVGVLKDETHVCL